MPKVKFNVKGVEARGNNFEPIPKGVYLCEIESCEVNTPQGKDERIEVVYTISKGDYKGRKLFDYINLVSDAASWKVREFLEAVGVVTDKKESGDFDPAKLVGENVMIRVAHQPGQAGTQWEGQVQSRVGSTFSVEDEELEDEDLSDDEAEEPEGDEESEGEEEPEGDDEEEEDEDEQVDLDELDRSELKALIKENSLEIRVMKKDSDDDIRKKIADLIGEEDDDEAADYSEMSVEDLRTTCKERGLSDKGSAKVMVARLEKDDEASKDGKDPF